MNTVKKLTCVVCPAGCPLEVTLDESGKILSVTGNTCKRGQSYAESELTHPVRTLTTTVKLISKAEKRTDPSRKKLCLPRWKQPLRSWSMPP